MLENKQRIHVEIFSTLDLQGTSMAIPGISLMGRSLVGSVGQWKDSLNLEPSQVRWISDKSVENLSQFWPEYDLNTKPSHSLGGWHVHGDCPACCLVENIWPGSTSSLRCRAGWSCQLEWLRPENHFLCDPSPFTLQEFLFIPFLLAFTCYIYFTWQVDKINITPVFPPVAYISPGRCWDWQNICTEGRAQWS